MTISVHFCSVYRIVLSNTDKNVSKPFPKRVVIWKAFAVKIAYEETNSSVQRVSDAARITSPQYSFYFAARKATNWHFGGNLDRLKVQCVYRQTHLHICTHNFMEFKSYGRFFPFALV